MLKLFVYYIALILSPNVHDENLIEQHVEIEINCFEYNGEMQISVLPKIKKSSEIYPYRRRFSYLLLNLPALHQSENREKRKTLNDLYPDTLELKNRYLNAYHEDEKLRKYFNATYSPIQNINFRSKLSFSKQELMDVASKFFFCDKILPDTSIQAYVCIGLNGVKEVSTDDGYKAMKICALNVLAQIEEKIGFQNVIGLNHIDAYYQAEKNWDNAPIVVNGASDLFVKILEEKGKHSRSIFGVRQLPRKFSVGLTATFTIKPD